VKKDIKLANLQTLKISDLQLL